MPAKPKITLVALYEQQALFMAQTRVDVSTIATLVKELVLELAAERREREESIERIIKKLDPPATVFEDIPRVEKNGNGHMGKDSRLPGEVGGSLQQVDDAGLSQSD